MQHQLEAIRRLLMTTEAIHAFFWLWPRDAVLSITDSSADDARPIEKTSTLGTPAGLALPNPRRMKTGRRGALLAPLSRCVAGGLVRVLYV